MVGIILLGAFFKTHGIVHFNLVSLFYVNYTSVKQKHSRKAEEQAEHAQREDASGSWEALSQHHLSLPAAAAWECLCSNASATDPDTHWPFQTTVLITHSHLASCPQARTSSAAGQLIKYNPTPFPPGLATLTQKHFVLEVLTVRITLQGVLTTLFLEPGLLALLSFLFPEETMGLFLFSTLKPTVSLWLSDFPGPTEILLFHYICGL